MDCSECTSERRLLCVSMPDLTVVCVYAPNSGRKGRLEFRVNQWEPSVRALISNLRGSSASCGGDAGQRPTPLIYLGDLNVAHVRALDCWGTTDSQWGNWKASGRTREEASALDLLLSECGLIDSFRHFHPSTKSGTCWAQKAANVPVEAQRQHWKRYDYALITHDLLNTTTSVRKSEVAPGLRVEGVQHLADAFSGGRPDHLPVQVVVTAPVLAAGSGAGARTPAKKRPRRGAGVTERRVRAASDAPQR
jgi:exonuclease III